MIFLSLPITQSAGNKNAEKNHISRKRGSPNAPDSFRRCSGSITQGTEDWITELFGFTSQSHRFKLIFYVTNHINMAQTMLRRIIDRSFLIIRQRRHKLTLTLRDLQQ